jgi:predicted amidohydrolase
MTALTLAAAQSVSIAGDVPANIERHLALMHAAAEHGVHVLVFPELSLTGYEPSLAAALAIAPEDALLAPLREMAREWGLTAVVGMPIRLAPGAGVLIGALVLGADGSLAVYTKQHLHPGEEAVFAPGQGGAALDIGDERIALAVCADFSRASHPRQSPAPGGPDGRHCLCRRCVDQRRRLRSGQRVAPGVCGRAWPGGAGSQPWRAIGWLCVCR